MFGQPGGVQRLCEQNQLCPAGLEIPQGLPHHLADSLIDRLCAEKALQHANPSPPHPVRIQEVQVALQLPIHTPGSFCVLSVIARDYIQGAHGILHCAADGTGSVLGHAIGHDPAAADQAEGGPYTDQTVGGGGAADGIDRIGTDADKTHVGSDGRPCPPRGTARCPGQVIRVTGLTKDGADGLSPNGELMQISLGQNQRPGLAQAFGEEGILRWDKTLQRAGASRGGHVTGANIVLQQNRNAMERTGEGPRLPKLAIQPFRLFQCLRVDGDDGIEGRPLLVIGLDTGQICLSQLPAGQPAIQHSLMYLCHRALHNRKGRHVAHPPILVPVLPWIPSFAFSSRVIRALRPWPDSANWRAASTLGSIEPGAKCPSEM